MTPYSAHYSQFVMPNHINVVQTLFGGQMIAWIDLAAAKVAFRFLKGSGADAAVTRVIKEVEFKDPVYLGEWVSFVATVEHAGKSSITIKVEATAEGRKSGKRIACMATVVMVSVKKDGDGQYIKFHHGKSCD